MRKFLLFAVATMISVAMVAAGGDGTSKDKAIYFDWENGHEHVGTKWYRVDLAQINGMVDPTLALYLTNLTDESVKVEMNGEATVTKSILGLSFSKDTTMRAEYTIAANDYQLWSQNVKQLLELNVPYITLQLTAEQKIMLSAKKYETSEIVDLACEDADDFDWSGVQVEAGEKWYRLNLAEVKAENKKLNFVVTNQGTQDATVAFDLSLDCPASVVFGYNWTIPAGGEMTEEFGRVFIDELKEDYVYLKLNTNQALELSVEEEPAPAPKDETWAIDATLEEGQAYTFSGDHIFEVSMATLSAPRGMKAEFVITNNTGVDAVLTKQISFANPVKNTIDKELVVAANSTVTKEVVNNMAGVITSETAYIRFNATQELTVQLNYVVVNEEIMNAKPVEVATCEKSQLLDWNSTIKQSGLETKWYEIDLATLKQNDEHLQLTFTNKSNNIVVVIGEIMRACEGDTLPYICPVPAGMSVSQVINYNLFALVPHPTHFYVSATVIPTTATSVMEFKDVRSQADLMKFVPKDLGAIQDAEVELTVNTISALANPADCNQATTIARGVKYEQAAGTTQWYRVTDELLNQLSLLPDVAFMNNGKQAANITVAAGVDCEHSTFGMSTFSLPTWADLTVFPIRLLGDLLDKALKQDVTEMYLQVTTDQPIAFGVDIDYGFGLGCDDAREFDWTQGAVIEKGDAQWLSFDITSVKQNKQQVRLTLTNESNSTAWVAMLTSLTCPFDVALPLVFPIPAGVSVDKVVDYSYFAATKLDELYVALITEETISVKAVAEKSQASASDYAACENAIEVKSGEAYENKGTQWYKFASELFSDMSRLPRFHFATPEGKTNITFGATVGCEYNIATKATLPLPGNLDISFRFPSRIFDMVRKFVHQDVTEVYVEMTTDKKLEWSIDMTYVDACESAIELDFSKPINLDLKANEDVWYKVDVNSIKALKDKNLEFALYNRNDKAVEVEVEVSPTCPVVVSASKTKSIAANDSLVYSIPTNTIINIHDNLLDQYPLLKGFANNLVYYVRVRANGDLTLGTDTVTPPAAQPGCEDAILLDWTKTINLSDLETGWYKFDISSIHVDKKDFTLALNNDLDEKKNIGFTLYKDCDTYMYGPLVLSFPVGITSQTIPYSMVTLLGDIDMLYVYIELDAKQPCENAIMFDWNKGFVHQANTTQWYEFDIASVLENKQQVTLTFTNHSDQTAWIYGEMALSCPGVSVPFICPVPAGMSVDKTVDYSFFEASRLQHFYIGLTSDATIELSAKAESAIVSDPTDCNNATEVTTGVLYEHAAGTHWYKFTGDIFDEEGHLVRMHFVNRSAKTVAMTMGATVGCDYKIATRSTIKLPRNLDLALIIPTWITDQLQKLVDDDVKEFYLELTTTQPIAFSFGMDPCEEAIPFDWTTGHTQEAWTTQWYEVDIASVKANKQQVKLTFTNHSNTTAWVGSLVSLECPYLVAMPVILPIPAGMSVDHVVDYSYFAATRLQHLYVGVTTEEKISIIAEAQSAEAGSNDQAACANAIEVKSGEVYENKGTQWYKFSSAFFDDASRFPQFMFAAPEGQTNVTLGATVGCEYNIANRGTFSVPNTSGLSLAFRFPSRILDVIKKFVNPAVTEFYLEMSSDKQVDWSLNMDYVGTCASAVDLDLSQPIHLDLKANEDVWYKVDVNSIKALGNKEIEYAIVNGTNDAVEIVAEVSPSCPVIVSAAATHSIAANDSLVGTVPAKLITAAYDNLLTKYADYDVLLGDLIYYVRVRATGDVTVDADTITPETPDFVESCKDADLLDWTKTIELSDLETGWYRLNISSLRENKNDFTLSLNNNTGDVKKLRFFFYEGCSDLESELESLFLTSLSVTAPMGLTTEKVPYAALDYLLGDEVDEFYVYLEIEGGELNEACMNAILLDDPNVPHTIQLVAGQEQWFKVATNALDKLQYNLKVTVDAEVSDVTVSVSSSCLVEPVIDTTVVLSNARYEEVELSKSIILDKWSKYSSKVSDIDTAYVRVLSTGNITLSTDTVAEKEKPQGCEDATLLDWTKIINLSDLQTGWYKFDISSVHTANIDFTLSLNNDLGEAKNLGFRLYKDCDSPMLGETVMTFPVGITSRTIPASLLSLVDGIDMLYVYLTIDAPLPCEDAILFDWNKGAYQEADKTQWYEFDITPVLEQEKQVKLTFTNHSNENAWVIAELALNCPYTKSIPMIVPVPAGMSVDKWIDYSVFEASRIEHFYLGVTTKEAAIELAATWEDARVAPSDGCLNATLVQTDSLYEHAAGTHWYKLTGDLFEGEGMFSRVHVINRSAEHVTITAGGTVGCEYNIATRAMFKLPKYFDLAFAIPVWVIEQMKKFVDDDVKEFYIELTTDQPIAFSFGMDRCEESILFDWTTGHTQGALTNQWYEVDIAPVLANEQQIKLTLTNHSNETAWVATLVSLDCPFKVALPLAFPIPAGMSVDKVIDYSYFAATRLDHIYVGVSTTETISIKAEAQNAVVTPTADCINATEILSGSTYVHNGGTSWYKVDGSLFADMGKLPKFQFATVSGKKTNITFGATVGCEYNIATRATLPVPGDVEVALRVPSFIFKVARKFIDYDVNEFYIELTTDEQIEFSIDATVEEDLDACLEAVDLVVSDSMTIDLVANTDMWYKVDLSAIKNLNKDLAVTVSNTAPEAVDIEVEVSPTCPIAATVLKRFTAPAATTATTVLTAAQINELLKEYPNLIYYVRVRATGDLHIEVSEPEVVEKEACEEAREYVWGTPTTVVADSDVWYAIDITDAKASGKDLYVTVKNIDDIAAVVSAEVLYDCPGTVQHSLTKTIGVGEALSTTLPSSDIQSVESNVLYLHLVTTGDIEVTVGEPEIVEDEDACENAIPLNWDEEVTVAAGDTAWYAVNIAEAKALQKNIKLTVKNESAESALVKADIAYDCPVSTFVHSLTKNIGARMSVSTTIDYAQFADVTTDVLYIRIITTGELTISATIDEKPIEEETTCEDAIPYELGTVVSLPANTDVWYAVNIAPAKVNQSDLELIINNESELENEVSAQISEECPVVDFLLEISAVLEPLGTIVETATYDKYDTYADVIYLHIQTSDVLNFVLKEIRTKKYETLLTEEFVCDGTEYVDPITSEKHIISSLIASTQAWADTVQIDEWLDSVYVFHITPIVAPVVMTDTLIATIPGATPVLTPGLVPNVVGTIDAIQNYYTLMDTDTIADVNAIYWTEASLNTIVDCAATSHTMTLVVEAGCDNLITTAMTFKVTPFTVVDSVENVTICYGETHTWNGKDYNKTGLYEVILPSVTGCDSIAKLNLTVLPEVPATIVEETVCAGVEFVWDANDKTYTESVKDTITLQNVLGCDSVVILHLTVLPAVAETVVDTVICYGESIVWNENDYSDKGRYTITLDNINGCDSVVTLNLIVLPDVETLPVENMTICYGDSYTWHGMTCNESKTYTYVEANVLGCDSLIYTLNLTVLPDVVTLPAENKTLCYGDSYTWHGMTCNESKTYTYVEKNVLGCDSLIYTLNLTVLPDVVTLPAENKTLCYGDSYTWHGMTCDESKTYTYVEKNVLGCDSIIYTLNLTVLPDVVTEDEELIVCESEFPYEWRGMVINQAGVYTVVEQYAATGCDSVIHTLNIQTYVLTLPATVAEVVAVCGNPIDVTAATADIEEHIAATDLYAPNAVITWYAKLEADWTVLTADPVKGSLNSVQLKYVISSDCGTIESSVYELTVQAPTPENDVDMDNVLAVSKYENRVFLLHLNDFVAKYGWTPTPEEVTWYKVVNTLDVYGTMGDDEVVGTGHYYNEPDGSIIKAGEYYALIVRTVPENPDECQTTMRTVVLTSGVVALAPQLIPNVARPNDNLTIINLNPDEVTEIRVYSTTGELMDTYVADQVAEFMFNAAHTSGYYMVDVQTANGKTTLRYVVK